MYGSKVTGVYDFSIESSCAVFMRICLCFPVLLLRFYRENGGGGGGGDGLSLWFILFLRHGLCGEFRVLCRFAYIGFV